MFQSHPQDQMARRNFKQLSKQSSSILTNNITILACTKTDGKVVYLQCFDDQVMSTCEGKTQYLIFGEDTFFDYSLSKKNIWFGNRENSSCESFVAENQTDLKLFLEFIKTRCSQSKFMQTFDLIEEKGKSKKSSVFTIRKKTDDKILAVKIQKYTSRLFNEISILRELQHPNMIYFQQFFIDDGNAFIVMDYEDGGSLLDIINMEIQLSPKGKIKIITDLLNGLQFLRIKGFVHRDLKPENILYSQKDGNYKIADFGLSKRVGEKLEKIAGTPGYMAPELLKQTAEQNFADIKSDIYSMGLIFYEILTCKRYYEGKNSDEILKKNMQKISLKKKEKSKSGFVINSMEYELLQKMIRSEPSKRKSSLQILKSQLFRKVNKAYGLDYLSSTTGSPSKSSGSGDQQLVNQDRLMDSFWNIIRIRSWSN